MFTFKPKKVFEKLNKMDRKQAYTLGAIAIVTVVALLIFVSAISGPREDSLEGLASQGYDLAALPFATDGAEQYLLASKYPDMQGNGSTLLYSPLQKEARQQEDAQETEGNELADAINSAYEDNTSAERSDNGGYGGYQGGSGGSGRGGGRGGSGKTEIGQLSATGMATAGGSGINATYGPSGDFRQFKGREDRGNEAPGQLKTGNARQAAAQFYRSSRAAGTFNENRMTGARKALLGGDIAGSGAFGNDGSINLSKLPSGLTVDPDAPPSSADLENLDKKLNDAIKKGDDKQKEEETAWWKLMFRDLAKQALSSLVGSIMQGVGDQVKGAINGSKASRAARKEYGTNLVANSPNFNDLSPADQKAWENMGYTGDDWNYWAGSSKKKANIASKFPSSIGEGKTEGNKTREIYLGSSKSDTADDSKAKLEQYQQCMERFCGGNKSSEEYKECSKKCKS